VFAGKIILHIRCRPLST